MNFDDELTVVKTTAELFHNFNRNSMIVEVVVAKVTHCRELIEDNVDTSANEGAIVSFTVNILMLLMSSESTTLKITE